ncbi:ubiquitin-like-conjugating enzyme ATG10 isoform X2 [Adelges cooleyi]|uniref:ubiquitin-like-conjugating enzyme ATG10 isoform X2 n=1 Tax=Adelges cooleyi TaxID=133065 RepID=UPI00217F5A92|nr:ubiquitin-like-conjugating enzyme ATG10 isoform X2 [Adelges cooleyi]
MSMSYHQFVEYAVSLKNHSDTIDDGWAMCEYTNALDNKVIKYLTKKEMLKRTKHLLNSDDSELESTDDSHIMCEYHILYNLSYTCPDLYFNMWRMNGKLLSLKHIWSLVHSSLKEPLIADKWNALTQKEHPLKNVPFFTLHPCQTTHIMKLLGFSEKKDIKSPIELFCPASKEGRMCQMLIRTILL